MIDDGGVVGPFSNSAPPFLASRRRRGLKKPPSASPSAPNRRVIPPAYVRGSAVVRWGETPLGIGPAGSVRRGVWSY